MGYELLTTTACIRDCASDVTSVGLGSFAQSATTCEGECPASRHPSLHRILIEPKPAMSWNDSEVSAAPERVGALLTMTLHVRYTVRTPAL